MPRVRGQGNEPWTFALEVALRLVVLYAILIASLRLMGRRMSSQLARNELLAVVALAAGMGPAVQSPDRGLLPPAIVATWVVLVQRSITWGSIRSRRFEKVVQGTPAAAVADGRVDLEILRQHAVSRARLFAQLRSAGHLHLGKVERVFLEPDGSFTMLTRGDEHPGLTLVPDWDTDLREAQTRAPDSMACSLCGNVRPRTAPEGRCRSCCTETWTDAVTG